MFFYFYYFILLLPSIFLLPHITLITFCFNGSTYNKINCLIHEFGKKLRNIQFIIFKLALHLNKTNILCYFEL